MEIYDSRYFNINKTLMSYVGLWPFDSKCRKFLLLANYAFLSVLLSTPHILGIRKFYNVDEDRTWESSGALMFIIAVYLKIFTQALAEKKVKVMYYDIAKNWMTIKDESEVSTLIEYSERGRFLTIWYIGYMIAALLAFVTLPLYPIIMDRIVPLNEPRESLFIMSGDYIIDREEHYKKIYALELFSCCLTTLIFMAVDTMYVVCIEHCVGLFAIVKYRLHKPNKLIYSKDLSKKQEDSSYNWVVQTIKLHETVLEFSDTIESSFSGPFFIIISLNILYVSLASIVVVMNVNKPLNLIRYSMLLVGTVIHLFYLSWPGQKLVDYSSGLFRDAYCSEWYLGSIRSKALLRLFMLRCAKPCFLTAGGMYKMNLENFLKLLKRSVSYITVFSSFR